MDENKSLNHVAMCNRNTNRATQSKSALTLPLMLLTVRILEELPPARLLSGDE
jgi:hypothetical protein